MDTRKTSTRTTSRPARPPIKHTPPGCSHRDSTHGSRRLAPRAPSTPIRVRFRIRTSSGRVRRCPRPIVNMQEMDPLDLLFERLVRAARDTRPELLTRPLEVSELIDLV